MSSQLSSQATAARESARTPGGQFGPQVAPESSVEVLEHPQWVLHLDQVMAPDRPASLSWASGLQRGITVPESPAVFDTDSHYDVATGATEVSSEVHVPAHREGERITTPAPSGRGTLTWDVDGGDRLTLVHASDDSQTHPEDITWSEFVGTVDSMTDVPAPSWDGDSGFDAVQFSGVRLVRDNRGNPLMATASSSWFEIG